MNKQLREDRAYAIRFARKGGQARAKALTAKQRSDIGRKGAHVRWNKVVAMREKTA